MAEQWYYGPENARGGPFSNKEIRVFIEIGRITPNTELCDKKGRCYSAIRTEFIRYFQPGSFVTDGFAAVSNRWVWLLIMMPAIVSLVMLVLYFMGIEPTHSAAFAPLAACAVAMDSVMLEKAGFQSVRDGTLWGILLYPVYIYKRAQRLLQKQTLLVFSILMFAIPIAEGLLWPSFDRKDIERLGMTITNQILPNADAVRCTNAELVKRLPYCKFEVAAHLSDRRIVVLPLVQSWQYVRLDLGKEISGDLAMILLQKSMEIAASQETPQ